MAIDRLLKLKNWCILPWTHAFVDPQGTVKPCCRFRGREIPSDHNVNNASLETIFNGPVYTNLRHQMLASTAPAGCQRCWEEEASGKNLSLRQNHNRRWEELVSPDWNGQPQISFVEVGLSNLCNLKCRMCDSRYSSKWIGDEIKLYGQARVAASSAEFSEETLRSCLSHLRHVKFTGGEPLLNPLHRRILSLLIESGRSHLISLNYSTNTTVDPGDELLALWSRFARVEVALSIDGLGALNDYVRHPSRWAQVEAVTRRFFQLAEANPQLHLGIRPSVSVYNLTGMPAVLKWWLALCEEFPRAGERARRWVSLTHVTLPEVLSLQVLPQSLKSLWHAKVGAEVAGLPTKMAESCLALCRYMLQEDRSSLLPQLAEFTKRLDELRGERLELVMPELAEVLIIGGLIENQERPPIAKNFTGIT